MRDITKCIPDDSWFKDYLECWRPVSECPDSYILFSAMACMGACIGRKVWFPQDVHKIYPLVSLLLIGPSGVGKSTAIRDQAIQHLVRPLPEDFKPQIVTGKSTKEALHDDLMANPHSIIFASELSNFFSKEKYMEGMIPYFTDLLDLAPVSVRTKSGGPAKVIKEPSVALMGGSTVDWLHDQLPNTASAGGFLPRFFIVKEEHKSKLIPYPDEVLTPSQKQELEDLRTRVFGIFRAFTDFHRGPMTFEDYEAKDTYGAWYQSFSPDTGILAPFAARAGVHIMRLSMLLALSRGKTSISADDLRSAICLFHYSLDKLSEVIVPMTAQGKMLAKLLQVIGDGEMSEVQIKRAMRNYCSAREVNQYLSSLSESREISNDGGVWRRVNY